MVHVAFSVDMFWLSRPFRKKRRGTWGEKEMIWDQLVFFGTLGICSGWWKKETSHECLKIVQCFFWTCGDFNMTSLNGPYDVNDEFGKKYYGISWGWGNFRMKAIMKKLGEVLQNHQQLVEKIMVLHKPLTMKPPQQSSKCLMIFPSHASGFPALTTLKNRTTPYCWHDSEIRRKKKKTPLLLDKTHHFYQSSKNMFAISTGTAV